MAIKQKTIRIIGAILILYIARHIFAFFFFDGAYFFYSWCIWHVIYCLSAFLVIGTLQLNSKKKFFSFTCFLALYATSHTLYIPDRIDFFMLKGIYFDKRLENAKKRRGEWNESLDVATAGYLYSTDYPWRIPLLADTKAVVYGPREEVKEIFGIKPESKLVHIYGKWYFYFYENNEMP
jgi:hypothetical protein